MGPQLLEWKKSLAGMPLGAARFERWFFVSVSGVLFARKPGELILVRERPVFGLGLGELLRRIKNRCREWGLFICEFNCPSGGVWMVIYDRARVNKALKNVRNTPFFIALGLGPFVVAEEFLMEMRRRWSADGRIPHEIGLALGYPVKDVVGFVNFTPIAYRGTFGWRVYGNAGPSLALKMEYDAAKQFAREFLE